MKRALLCVLTVLLLVQARLAEAGGLFPWQFGMSKEQVASFAEQGPYKSFKNGDLETYNGVFDGHKENVQFFFDEHGLRRIGVYVYEGTDPEAAAGGWRRAYVSLEKDFGTVEVPGMHGGHPSEPLTADVVATFGSVNTKLTGKTQMAPVKQPSDMFVFSSFRRGVTEGTTYYYVTIYFDPHS